MKKIIILLALLGLGYSMDVTIGYPTNINTVGSITANNGSFSGVVVSTLTANGTISAGQFGGSLIDFKATAASNSIGWGGAVFTFYSYYIIGKEVTILVDINQTSTTTNTLVYLPVSSNISWSQSYATSYCRDNTVALTGNQNVVIAPNDRFATVYKDSYSGSWTASGSKTVRMTLKYLTN